MVVGDIGSKLALPRYDHGFLQLNNLKIPRNNFLAKYIQITKEG